MKKKISVIVPVYNVQAYLKECLDSVCAQTYGDLEIICVNDGSTDDSASILQAYAAKDERITVITQENAGLAAARNRGLKEAHGEAVCFIDSDDRVHPTYVEELQRALSDSAASIAVSDMTYFTEDGSVSFSDGGAFSHTNARLFPSLVTINNSACNKLFRTDLFDDCPFPEGMLYEDLATVPILLYKAERVVKVNAPLYAYRQRSGSIRHTISRRIFDIYDAIGRCLTYVRQHGDEEEIRAALKHLYITHGLDAITLKIKDMETDTLRPEELLAENMAHLRRAYPEYRKDTWFQKAGFRKKLIWSLLACGQYAMVMRLYGKR